MLTEASLDINKTAAVLIDIDLADPTGGRRTERAGEGAAAATGDDAYRLTWPCVSAEAGPDSDDPIGDLGDQGHVGDLVALAGIMRVGVSQALRRSSDADCERDHGGDWAATEGEAGGRNRRDKNARDRCGGEHGADGSFNERGLHPPDTVPR